MAKPSETVQVTVKLPRELLTFIDERVAQALGERNGINVSRADIVREMLWRAHRELSAKPVDGMKVISEIASNHSVDFLFKTKGKGKGKTR
jgi:Arc/MetJ-type ribon-helix-helix transcriptional regulator